MPKFRYSTDSGVTWTDVDDDLPYNIAVTAEQDVIVEPLGAAVSNLGTISGNFLSLTYDASDPADDVAAFTNIAGTFYWCITESITPPSATDIIAGTGFVEAGSVGTVEGAFAFTLPTLDGETELFFHAVVDGAERTNVDTVRVQIGSESSWIGISGTTGSPTIHDYTDGDGDWRAYEFTANGSFTVNVAGGLEYELVAGGGGGGGGVGFTRSGGGGAGGVLRGTTTLTTGTYSVVVGAGGIGATGGAASTNGANSTAIGLTAVGGGHGGSGNAAIMAPAAGGSGGGHGGVTGTGGAATSGQGFAGGDGQANGGGGGGGAAAVGSNGVSTIGGNGGAGITSVITGTSRGVAGGGAGSGSATSGTASHGGGAAAGPGTTNAGSNATTAGAGGGAGNGTGAGGAGFRGHFILRVQV